MSLPRRLGRAGEPAGQGAGAGPLLATTTARRQVWFVRRYRSQGGGEQGSRHSHLPSGPSGPGDHRGVLVGPGGWIDARAADAAGGSERMGGAAAVDAVDGLSDVSSV